mmetsp:Transcript_8247/g.22992  ORF Transcript_8247/g.22992 Transcript_8247/m.22992 type:complete len:283 (+) Transcript_8247:250-1098(+)
MITRAETSKLPRRVPTATPLAADTAFGPVVVPINIPPMSPLPPEGSIGGTSGHGLWNNGGRVAGHVPQVRMHSAVTFKRPKPEISTLVPQACEATTDSHVQYVSPPSTWQKLDSGNMSSQGSSGCVFFSQISHDAETSFPRATNHCARNARSERCASVIFEQNFSRKGSTLEENAFKTSHMATAPAWCGIIPRAKSTSFLHEKLMDMPVCISWFASINCFDEGHVTSPHPITISPMAIRLSSPSASANEASSSSANRRIAQGAFSAIPLSDKYFSKPWTSDS